MSSQSTSQLQLSRDRYVIEGELEVYKDSRIKSSVEVFYKECSINIILFKIFRMKPYYIQCIKDGPFKPKMAEGADKPESQWTPDKRRVDFQENYDDEADERTSEEYLRDLDLEFHERDINQGEPKVQKDYKAEYKKMKAKVALLEASPPTSQSSKPFQSKNKGLGAKMFNYGEEEVFDDEEETRVQVLMALADDELSVGKNNARNGQWIDITMRKVERLNPDSKLPNFNTGRILVPKSESVNECLKLTEGSSPSSELMTLTYKVHSPRERSGLGTMKHTKPETQESPNKNISGPVAISNLNQSLLQSLLKSKQMTNSLK
ncbi:hypothetical protein Tco_1428668 [Tanacetum coccineum]